ncbi:MAG: serine/threonine protein kinase, partial [Myxococcales bacterium]|nr:serine/threonine protein kinase [Myxococcales bacterium]
MRARQLKPLSIGATGQDTNGLKYRLVAPLDRGGMGELFIAEVGGSGDAPKHAVVKRLLLDLVDDADYVEMFRDEAEIMARLNHPNIVRVLGLPVLGGSDCLALEYIEGRSVQQLVSRGGQLHVNVPPGIAAYIALCMAEALDHVHHARSTDGRPLELVHRDVSPGNVLLGFNGDVKLTDFGIAKTRLSNVSTTVGIVKGKARYLAPEQILGKNATAKSDLFSAAVVFIEILTSKPLFERGTIPKTLYAIVNGERPALRELLPRQASPLAPILEKALETDPNKRMPSAQALANYLKEVIPNLGPSINKNELGQHLRGLFEGTKGPLARIIPSPSVSLPTPGSAPLKPENFPQQPRAETIPSPIDPSPVDLMGTPAGQSDLRERSTVSEVDDALSVLAWLQSRDSPPPSAHRPVRQRVRRRYRPLKRFMLLTTGWLLGLTMSLLAVVLLETRRGPLIELLKQVDGLERYMAKLAPPKPTSETKPPAAIPTSKQRLTSTQISSGLSFTLRPQSPTEFVGPPKPPPPPEPTPPAPPPEPARMEILGSRRTKITLNGKKLATRPITRKLRLDPGVHHIKLQIGRVTRDYDVLIRPGETVKVGKAGIRRLELSKAKPNAGPSKKPNAGPSKKPNA